MFVRKCSEISGKANQMEQNEFIKMSVSYLQFLLCVGMAIEGAECGGSEGPRVLSHTL